MTEPKGTRLARTGLISLMVLCSVMLVGNVPVWIWIGSQVTASQQPGLGPYMLVAGGVLATVLALAFALSRINRVYERLAGGRQTVRVRLPWLRSLRDESGRAPRLTVLDTVLVGTALATVAGFGIWFFAFAGSSLPGA